MLTFKTVLGFHIRLVVAGQSEAERRVHHRHHGHRFCPAICHVQHGSDERTARAHGRQPVGHQDMLGDWLPGIRRVRHRTPVPEGDGAGAWLLLDGRLAGMLDGVSDSGSHGSCFQNGVRAVRPGGMRTRWKRPSAGCGQESGQRTTGEMLVVKYFQKLKCDPVNYATYTSGVKRGFEAKPSQKI